MKMSNIFLLAAAVSILANLFLGFPKDMAPTMYLTTSLFLGFSVICHLLEKVLAELTKAHAVTTNIVTVNALDPDKVKEVLNAIKTRQP